MSQKAPNWDKIRAEYLADQAASLSKLSIKYSVPIATLKRRAAKEQWASLKEKVDSAVDSALIPEITTAITRARVHQATVTAQEIMAKQAADLQWLWDQMAEQARRLIEVEQTREVASKVGPMEIRLGAMDRLAGLKQAASASKDMQASIRKALGMETEGYATPGATTPADDSRPLDDLDDAELTRVITDQIRGS